ncbi:KDM5 [Mytilus coruscus]|uniref:KDM5 n=1 Tax=Mytilus coruscus TaxID=42192 RepID=A0A6J8DSA9_MYTCO|nr:KDM5 [Mytilus coruscus]
MYVNQNLQLMYVNQNIKTDVCKPESSTDVCNPESSTDVCKPESSTDDKGKDRHCSMIVLELPISKRFIFDSRASDGDTEHTVLQMTKECGYNVFDVWNLKHVYCGSAGSTDLYRHDYIDNIDLTCVSYLKMIFETDKLSLRYNNPITDRIESILSRKPDSSSPGRSPLYNDYYMTNTNNRYEFLWLDSLNSTLYAGIYHSTDISKAPQYVYNVFTSSPYTANGDPKDFNDINAANDVEIVLSIKDGCVFVSSTSRQSTCPGYGTPSVHNADTYIEVPAGESVTIDCTYTAYGLATKVEWTFDDNSGGSYTITDGTNVSKYSGSTVHIPSLTVNNFAISDEGIYKCSAENSYGRGTGVDIQLVIIQASTVSLTETASVNLKITTLPLSTHDRTSMQIISTNDKTTTKDVSTSQRTTTDIMSTTRRLTTDVLSITTKTTNEDITSKQATTESLLSENHASSILPGASTENIVDEQQCVCSCEYKARLEYWRNQTVTNYTMDELRLILSPKLKEMEELLKVDKQNISSYLNKFTSAPDDRVSSQSIGADNCKKAVNNAADKENLGTSLTALKEAVQTSHSVGTSHCIDETDDSVADPSLPRPKKTRKTTKSSGVNEMASCICNSTARGDMIRCDWCRDWFHEKCMDIKKNEKIGFWVCSVCRDIPMSIKRIEYQLNSVLFNNMDLVRDVASRTTQINELSVKPKETKRSTGTLLIGNSVIRDINKNKFVLDMDPICVRGGKINDITERLMALPKDTELENIIIQVGSNDFCSLNFESDTFNEDYKILVATAKSVRENVVTSGLCPRLDDSKGNIVKGNKRIKQIANDENFLFIDNDFNFRLLSGAIDMSLYNRDGVHLNTKGVAKLVRNLDIIPKEDTGRFGENTYLRIKNPEDMTTSAQAMLIPIVPRNKPVELVVECIPISVTANHQDLKGIATTQMCQTMLNYVGILVNKITLHLCVVMGLLSFVTGVMVKVTELNLVRCIRA